MVTQLTTLVNKHMGASRPFILAIGGAADLGKSHLANSLKKSLSQQHHQVACLSLDSFLMNRAYRLKHQLSGYMPDTYYWKDALSTLQAIQQGQAVAIHPYDHQTGRQQSQPAMIPPQDILIFEGLFALHPDFSPYVDLSLFLYTNDEQLVAIRHAADLVKRGYTEAFSKSISQSELQLYQKHIAPLKAQAQYSLFLEKKWEYRLEANT